MVAYDLFTPQNTPVLGEALHRLETTMLGEIASVLCVLAIALVGFRLLAGHLAVRSGIRTLLGLFLIIGSPLVAARIAPEPDF